jgi:hypothetical protein
VSHTILHDLTGKRFGSWRVIAYIGSGEWVCECVCGRRRDVGSKALRIGTSKSCGCKTRGGYGHIVPPINSPTWVPLADLLAAHLLIEPTATVELLRWIRHTLQLSGDMARHLLAYGDESHWYQRRDGKWTAGVRARAEAAE